MARVADFAQFSDTSIDLRIGGDIDRTLTRNLDATPASGEGAKLTWMVRREGAGSVTYEVKVNGSVLSTYTVTVGDWVAVHETMSTDAIHFSRAAVGGRPADGRGKPRRPARVFHQFAVRELGRHLLPRRRRRLDGSCRCGRRERWDVRRSAVLPARRRLPRTARTPDETPGRRRVQRLVLLCRVAEGGGSGAVRAPSRASARHPAGGASTRRARHRRGGRGLRAATAKFLACLTAESFDVRAMKGRICGRVQHRRRSPLLMQGHDHRAAPRA